MPIYEYRCPDCHQIFEEWCKHAEDSDVTHACPVCSAKSKRLMSQTTFVLAGGGWYATEYGNRSKAPEAEKSDKAAESAPPPSASPASAASASQSTPTT